VTGDGNRLFAKYHHLTTGIGQGRTRLDREIPMQGSLSHPTAAMHEMVTITIGNRGNRHAVSQGKIARCDATFRDESC